ncbi:MAG: quinone-dependent dihydroorotate dehydrogenase [Lewinellaceae bacterium]|nr:quinone-dependent dihydroorotate dehydrogenase [Lewinellaceae bacterium]
MYKSLLKPLFFLLPPEKAHHLTVLLLKITLAIPGINLLFRAFFRLRHPALRREVFGLKLENPVGLAAGFDKDGRHFRAMASLGFGSVEIGTVTPKGQPGNPLPRLFRLPADNALINRMGFNNKGVDALVANLRRRRPKGLIVGGNIGKNKNTPNEEAGADYATCFEALFPYVDYFVVNVSSPNTPNLRELQEKEPLARLLSQLQALNRQKAAPKPMLLKIAPDLSNSQLDDILDIVGQTGIDGLIATNTTISRQGLTSGAQHIEEIGPGGLSGQPLRQRSTEVIRYLYEKSGGKVPIIGVGGIASPQDAIEKLQAGASLLQVYTGLVFEGPALVRRINKALIARKG